MTGDGRRLARSRAPLGPGAVAPGFALSETPYSRLSLGDLRGRAVVLVFYVADWHPVATAQLSRYQELLADFADLDAVVVGISTDGTWSHESYAQAAGITFPLLADASPPGEAARSYGVYEPDVGRSRRALFVIDRDGTIRWSAVFPDSLDPGVDGVLSTLEALRHDRNQLSHVRS